MSSIKRIFKSFHYAWSGLSKIFWEERNFRIDLIIAVIVLFLSIFLQIKVWEFIIIVLIVSFVLVLEILNTIFERFTDLLKPRIHEYVKDIKDMTASAVLIGAIASVIIGLLIFLPYFLK